MDDVFQTVVFGVTLADLAVRFVVLLACVVAALLVQHAAVRGMRRALDSANVPSASIFVNIVRIAIWSLALLAVLKPVFGVDPNALVAALGVTSVALSLGLQDTVANLVSGLTLMLSRVVRPGDDIAVGGVTGRVTDVTWRSTTIRTRGGAVEVIPNSVLNKTQLTRVTTWTETNCEVPFVVAPTADLDDVAREVLELAVKAAGEDLDPEVPADVVFTGITAFGTQGRVRVHVRYGVVQTVVADRVTRAIQGAPWLASALDNTSNS